MTNNVVTIHNAKLKTVAVAINTITVDARQMTLAIFRQLIDEDLIGDEGALMGTPWGKVNYHPKDDDCPMCEHWHVVWQKGDQLRRTIVEQNLRDHHFGGSSIYSETAESYMLALFRDIKLNGCTETMPIRVLDLTDSYESYTWRFERKGFKVIPYTRSSQQDKLFGQLKLSIQRGCHDWEFDQIKGDRRALLRKIDDEIERHLIARKNLERSLSIISKLPQLFIAV